jgi:hypothetical protein
MAGRGACTGLQTRRKGRVLFMRQGRSAVTTRRSRRPSPRRLIAGRQMGAAKTYAWKNINARTASATAMTMRTQYLAIHSMCPPPPSSRRDGTPESTIDANESQRVARRARVAGNTWDASLEYDPEDVADYGAKDRAPCTAREQTSVTCHSRSSVACPLRRSPTSWARVARLLRWAASGRRRFDRET